MKPLAGPAIDDFSLQNFNSYLCAELRCRAARKKRCHGRAWKFL